MMVLEIKPVTLERWEDLERLFAAHGNPNYCWCMTWRVSSSAFRAMGSDERRAALHDRVQGAEPVGLLAYQDDEPVAWCSVAPRKSYARLERSRTIKRLDDRDTWSIVCLFVAPQARGRGLSAELLKAAVAYAKENGAEVVEGYPVEPEFDDEGNWHPARSYRFMGYVTSFVKAGFVDVTPPDSTRRIMRYEVQLVG
jgi:GNAT superfamily N-acetyltransferase